MKSIVNQSGKILKKTNIILGIFLLFIIILIAINPAKYSLIAFKGIEIWAKVLLPSLLPFFILTKLFASTGVIDGVTKIFSPFMSKLYNCPSESAYVFFMSILTGYPVGSKLVSDLYNNSTFDKAQAIRTTAFCSNSGPMFILGSVAIGMFCDRKMGIIILASHIIGALLNGLLYRNYGKHYTNIKINKNVDYIFKTKEEKNNVNLSIVKDKNKPLKKIDTTLNSIQTQNDSHINNSKQYIDFSSSVVSSINSILLIGGVICFTFVLLEVITSTHLFNLIISLLSKIGLNKNLLTAIFCGFGEITKGCLLLSQIPLSTYTSYCICTFIISFGGISTFLQAQAFLKNIVPSKIFLLQKTTHAILSCMVCGVLGLIV